MANHGDLLIDYQSQFQSYKNTQRKLKNLIEEHEKAKADQDYFQFLFDELDHLNTAIDEQEALENEINSLTHAEVIKNNLQSAVYLIEQNEDAAIGKLKAALQQIHQIEKYQPALLAFTDRLKSAIIELKDLSAELENIEQSTSFNAQKADEINDRLGMMYALQKKHRVNSNVELIAIQNELSEKLQKISFGDEDIQKMEKELANAQLVLANKAKHMSMNRAKIIPEIESYLVAILGRVGMPNAQIKIEQSLLPIDEFTKDGIDQIKFLFNANKGHQLNELNKVASGGELSRLMLSIKSLIAKKTALPTIIFDEIDTGVSGEVANSVGNIMQQLAQDMQVISITHLPQMASKGKAHYFVYKEIKNDFTYTQIKRLNQEERILEIAKMLSGANPKESAIQNAKELLEN